MRILSTQAQAVQAKASSVSQVDSSSTMLKRFTVTAEVAVSKIFPAGAGWQTGAVLAGQQGLAGTSRILLVTHQSLMTFPVAHVLKLTHHFASFQAPMRPLLWPRASAT